MDDDEGARGASGGAARGRGARNHGKKANPHPDPLPLAGEGKKLRVTPNKNRRVQVRRVGKRKLFDKARKESFLEWFAGTCNVVLSAQMAGVCDKTVYKHLLKDPAFVEAFMQALKVGYLRIEAREMMEAHRPALPNDAQDPATIGSAADGSPPSAGIPPVDSVGQSLEARSALPSAGEEYQIRILPDEDAEEHFDPALAMQLLREHHRRLAGEPRPAQRTTARSASTEEVVAALTRRLKHFSGRVGAPSPQPLSGEGERG